MVTLINWFTTRPWGRYILWIVYLVLLGVLLPHTAWAFGRFEPESWHWLGWVAATAFDGAIATFTWWLKGTIEAMPRHRSAWLRFRRRYVNVCGLGLLLAIAISSAVNWAHSVQFSQPFAVFGQYSVPVLAEHSHPFEVWSANSPYSAGNGDREVVGTPHQNCTIRWCSRCRRLA